MAITAIPSSLGHTLPWVQSVIAFRDRVTLDRGPKEEQVTNQTNERARFQ